MLLQKTFHIHRSVSETRCSLANIHGYRRQLSGLKQLSISADGMGRIELAPALGQTVFADFIEVPCEKSAECVTFRSVKGNIQFAGMCEFFRVKDNLTEVVVTIDYRLTSSLHRAAEWVTSSIERFVNRQIEQIQIYFDGMHAVSHIARELPRSMNLTHSPRFA